MNLSIQVSYPKCIALPLGTLVQVNGVFDDVDHIQASFINDSNTGITYQLHPDEIREAKPYGGQISWELPLIGQVISCHQYGPMTMLSIFPTGHRLFNYNQLLHSMNRTAVPAFWKLSDERHKWGKMFIPSTNDLWDMRKNRSETFDLRAVCAALHEYAAIKSNFNAPSCIQFIVHSTEKSKQVDRHLARLNLIYDLRRHLYAASQSDGREFLLGETREEAALTAEAAAATAYSSLDVLSHALDAIFLLDKTSKNANFMNVVTNKATVEETASLEKKNLENTYFNLPLTNFLLQERHGWISQLEKWRHYTIHQGRIEPGEHIEGGVPLYIRTNDEGFDSEILDQADAVELVRGWAEHLRTLLLQTLQLVSQYVSEQIDRNRAVNPLISLIVPEPIRERTKVTKVLKEFLKLWQSVESQKTESDTNRKVGYMYSRLSQIWQKEWPFEQFRLFIQNHPLMDYKLLDSSGGTDKTFGSLYSYRADLKFRHISKTWVFAIIPEPTKKPTTAKTEYALHHAVPYGVPLSFAERVKITNFHRTQSGRDTGYRDVVFSGTIKNSGQQVLTNVTVHIFWMLLSNSNIDLGILKSGEEREFTTNYKDAYVTVARDLPPVAKYLFGSLQVRVIYNLLSDEGHLWAEDTTVGVNHLTGT